MENNVLVHFDYSTGASGDKTLAALLEVCESMGWATLADLRQLFYRLLPDANINISLTKVSRCGVLASHITVSEDAPPMRHWHQIATLLESHHAKQVLGTHVAGLSYQVFLTLAQAEAEVHGVELEKVHFHEIGAADTIVDIVGCCWLLQKIGKATTQQRRQAREKLADNQTNCESAISDDARHWPDIHATALALGAGTVSFSHGSLPVPTPATARLVAGLMVTAGIPGEPGEPGELTTPTGAALAKVLVKQFSALPRSRVVAVGFGAGSRELDGWANVTRCLIAERDSVFFANQQNGEDTNDNLVLEQLVLLESNLDHCTPEALAFACDKLLSAGALDVWQEPITMKKGRLAIRLCVLCRVDQAKQLTSVFVAETATLGVRASYVERAIIDRSSVVLSSPYGQLPFKQSTLRSDGSTSTWLRPEHDAVASTANRFALPFPEVYKELMQIARHSSKL